MVIAALLYGSEAVKMDRKRFGQLAQRDPNHPPLYCPNDGTIGPNWCNNVNSMAQGKPICPHPMIMGVDKAVPACDPIKAGLPRDCPDGPGKGSSDCNNMESLVQGNPPWECSVDGA
jgi:hypothetical protein